MKSNVSTLLSNRELEIIDLISQEHSNQDIAKYLGISKCPVDPSQKKQDKKYCWSCYFGH